MGTHLHASMGPRLMSRGKNVQLARWWWELALQWGRGS